MQAIRNQSPEIVVASAADFVLLCGRVQRLAKRLAGIPAASTSWRALHLIEAYGPLTMSEFTDLEGHTLSSSTRQVKRLENGGLIARTQDPGDRRSFTLTITKKGVRQCRDFERSVGEMVVPLLARLSDADQQALRMARPALERLLDLMRYEHGFKERKRQ